MAQLDQSTIKLILRDFFTGEWSKLRSTLPTEADGEMAVEEQLYGASGGEEVVRGWIAGKSYPRYLEDNAKQILASAGIDADDVSADDMNAVCEGIARAWLDIEDMRCELLEGHPEKAIPQDPLYKGLTDPLIPTLQSGGTDKTLEALVGKYRAFKEGGSWSDKTASEAERVLGWFIETAGASVPIVQVKKDHVREFRDLLDSLPSGFAQKLGHTDLPFKAMVEAGKTATKLAHATRAKYLRTLNTFLGWCSTEGYIEANPATGIKVQGKASDPHDARLPFSKEQLKDLFHSPQYTGHFSNSRRSKPGDHIVKDSKYWIPLVGLFTGMRLGEIVQLTVSDIKEDEGISYIDVNKDEGKQLKTSSSQRVIPVHQILRELGFLAYVEKRRKAADNPRLFPEVQPGKNGYASHNFSKYFGRYLKQIGVKTDKTVFHSFRHNFEDGMCDGGVELDKRKLLLGHHDGSITSSYGSKPKPKTLAGDIEKYHLDVDLSHLLLGGEPKS
jgi:integrase